MATALPDYYCHKCQIHIGNVTNMECPHCQESFIEELPAQTLFSRSRRSRLGGNPTIQINSRSPHGNTRIFLGGSNPSNYSSTNRRQQVDNPDIGTFFQAVLSQLVSGATAQQHPFIMQGGSGTPIVDPINLDTFLNQFLNQLGENSGPAPASENRINSIPTVKITNAQARDSLQCTICMDDFKENDEAKRLPCSHHFHEPCISRWLRMHGTCPTCRVTLDGDNTTNREYYNIYSDRENSSSRSNNRRYDRDNNGSSSANGSTLFDFD